MSAREPRAGAGGGLAAAVMGLLGRGGAAGGAAVSARAGSGAPSAEPSPGNAKGAVRVRRGTAAAASPRNEPAADVPRAPAGAARRGLVAGRAGTPAGDSPAKKDAAAARAPAATAAKPRAAAASKPPPSRGPAAKAPSVSLAAQPGDEDATSESDEAARIPAREAAGAGADLQQPVNGGADAEEDVMEVTAEQAAADAAKRAAGVKRYRAMEKPEGCPGDVALLLQVSCSPLRTRACARGGQHALRWRLSFLTRSRHSSLRPFWALQLSA